MKATEVIERFCKLQAEVMERHLGFSQPADCFCGKGGGFGPEHVHSEHYRNDGHALEFIELCVRARLDALQSSPNGDGNGR